MHREVGLWIPKSWKQVWAMLFFSTNLVLFSNLLLLPFLNLRYSELTLIYTRHIHILILYIIFCAILLIPISKIIEPKKTKFWRELFYSVSMTAPFALSFSLIIALTHGAVREAFTGYLLAVLSFAPIAALIGHFKKY